MRFAVGIFQEVPNVCFRCARIEDEKTNGTIAKLFVADNGSTVAYEDITCYPSKGYRVRQRIQLAHASVTYVL